MAFEDSQTIIDGKEAIDHDSRRFMPGRKMGTAKDSKAGQPTVGSGAPTSKGFLGGGKENGFVNTPIQDLKGRKAFKGGKSR